MIEPAGIAQYCIDRAKIDKNLDNKILILGCGAISMLISSILYSMGIKDITILDKVNDRLLYAKKYFNAKKLIKQDLKKNTNPHRDLNNAFLKNKIKELKEENKLLKNQLLDVKVRLKSIINNIQSYVY